MDWTTKKIFDVIKSEQIEKIDEHEMVVGDFDYDDIQIKISNSTKITLKNGDIVVYISKS